MTTGGEGGMLVTDDRELWKRAWSVKDHGKDFDLVHTDDHPPGFRWLHTSFGSNYRMTEMQAAIGRLQLAKLDPWVAERRRNSERVREGLAAHPALRVPKPPAGLVHAGYRLYAFVDAEQLASGWSRDRILESLADEHVPALSGSCSEIYLENAFEGTGSRPARRLPVARELGESSLAFLVHPGLTDSDLDSVIGAVDRVMERAVGS